MDLATSTDPNDYNLTSSSGLAAWAWATRTCWVKTSKRIRTAPIDGEGEYDLGFARGKADAMLTLLSSITGTRDPQLIEQRLREFNA